ncbi:MAG: GIY-YIG nuclease family protein [Patescibacteria group bacterium]
MTKVYYIYIVTNHLQTALYIGMTNNLLRRIEEHRLKVVPGFSNAYQTSKLVYYEETSDVLSAIQREKQLKGLLRRKKEALIASMNPFWKDLSEEF